jgi:hypothetical protein
VSKGKRERGEEDRVSERGRGVCKTTCKLISVIRLFQEVRQNIRAIGGDFGQRFRANRGSGEVRDEM